uniref:Uncharacterized protein n=1 Tax=Photinus pyralis TaxID=7054 RepID=A0A1Y1LM65_PHOPY
MELTNEITAQISKHTQETILCCPRAIVFDWFMKRLAFQFVSILFNGNSYEKWTIYTAFYAQAVNICSTAQCGGREDRRRLLLLFLKVTCGRFLPIIMSLGPPIIIKSQVSSKFALFLGSG